MASLSALHCHFRSKTLDMDTDVNVLIPDVEGDDIPVLYLLHGMHGDYTSWQNGSAIGKYARTRKIAVVMPSAQNSFYCNMKYGYRYFDFITEELPAYLARMFPILSRKREKTFIAGLSMGGYGAVKLALRCPDRYAAAASLSGCLDLACRAEMEDTGWGNIAIANWGFHFGETFPGSDEDTVALLDRFPKDREKPRIYFACGTEDFLYAENQTFLSHIKNTDFEYKYEEGPGIHDWIFWDKWILPAIDYMIG